MAAPFLVEITQRGDQHRRRREDRDARLAEQAAWRLAPERLDDLAWWCWVQTAHLAGLTDERKWLAPAAPKVGTQV